MKGSIFGYLEGGGTSRRGQRLSRDLAKHEEWTEAILPADAEADAMEGETNRRPLRIFGAVVALVMTVLVLRLADLQIVGGGHNLALADGNRIREKVERAPRGIIYDRNKQVLAKNQASFDVTVVPQQLPQDAAQRQALYAKVAALTGVSASDIQAKAEVTCKTHEPGCLDTSVPQLVAPGIDRDKALLVDQSTASLPGFSLDVNPVREYDDNNMLSAFLGYTSRVDPDEAAADPTYGPTDLIGKLGIEKQYESILRGKNGGEETEVDASGKPIHVLASQNPVPGNNLVLSVDLGLEQEMTKAIQEQMTASGAERASGVAINPKTGEVLAAVSLPSYDNNLFSKGISQTDYTKLVNDPGQPLFNKVTSGNYPSGSIIKPLGASAALQEGVINANTIVNDTGELVVPNQYDPAHPSIFYGWEHADNTAALGAMNVVSALAQSSDIFFYEVMGGLDKVFNNPLGVTKLTSYYQKFGLGSKTGIDLPSETAGRVPTPAWKKQVSGDAWYPGDTYNIAIGQGDMLVSPLQMAVALSAIANGGSVLEPHFLDSVLDPSGKVVSQTKTKVVRSNFISPQNLSLVRQGMLAAVYDPKGTACCKIGPEVPVQVAAKTGTAETVVHDTGESVTLQSKPDAWAEGFAPYNDPDIAIVILVEHAGEGASYAVPAMRETLAWYFTQGTGAKH